MGSSGTGVCAAIVDDKVRPLTQLARIPRDIVSMKFCVVAFWPFFPAVPFSLFLDCQKRRHPAAVIAANLH
jgi:hypothetical protein